MSNKKENILLKDEEIEEVSGGGCWFGARFVAPDGHDVGCSQAYYRVQFDDKEFCRKFPSICPKDGNPHDTNGRQNAGGGNAYIMCSRCGHYVDKQGNFHEGSGVVAD